MELDNVLLKKQSMELGYCRVAIKDTVLLQQQYFGLLQYLVNRPRINVLLQLQYIQLRRPSPIAVAIYRVWICCNCSYGVWTVFVATGV